MNRNYVNSFPALQKRGIILAIILSFITCGIYAVIWQISLNNEIRKENAQSQDGVLMCLVSLITCGLVYLYWIYRMGNDLSLLSKRSHQTKVDSMEGIICLVLAFFGLGLISLAILQTKVNELADE